MKYDFVPPTTLPQPIPAVGSVWINRRSRQRTTVTAVRDGNVYHTRSKHPNVGVTLTNWRLGYTETQP